MNVYVINLDRNETRLSAINERLKHLGIVFERIPAVDGRTLKAEDRKKLVAQFKWWCVRGGLPRVGEIGCALSHIAAYRKLLDSDGDCCCVLEDDDQFDPRFKQQLERIESWIDCSRPQVVLLTNYTGVEGGDLWQVVRSKGDSSAEAYVITRAAARSLLRHIFPVWLPSDGWRYWTRRGWIELYHAFPTMIPATWMLPGYVSDVCPPGERQIRVSDMSFARKLCWKLSRALGLILARAIIR